LVLFLFSTYFAFIFLGISIEIINPSHKDSSSGAKSNFTIHYKPEVKIDSKKEAGAIKLDHVHLAEGKVHHKKCNCESCQVLFDTYNEFVDACGKEDIEADTGPSPQKIAKGREESSVHICQICTLTFTSYETYRFHLLEVHPRHWQTIREFGEKRKFFTKKEPVKEGTPSAGNFFRKELVRREEDEVQRSAPHPQNKSSKETDPVTYFYPMLYPVYFVMDKNQQVQTVPGQPMIPPGGVFPPGVVPPNMLPPGMLPPGVHLPRGMPGVGVMPTSSSSIPSAPQIPYASMPPPGPMLVPPQIRPILDPSGKIIHIEQVDTIVNTTAQKFACGDCGLNFQFREDLVLHKRIHDDKPFKCDSCEISFKNNVDLKRHFRSHESIKCSDCKEYFLSQEQLVIHQNLKHNDKPVVIANEKPEEPNTAKQFMCESCKLSFANNVELKRHYRTHSALKCSVCHEIFVSKDLLAEHIHTCHGLDVVIKNDTTKCDVCDFTFRDHKELKNHMRLHVHSDPIYPCHQCGVTFIKTDALQEHLKTHTLSKNGENSKKVILGGSNNSSTPEHLHSEEEDIKNLMEKKYFCDVCGSGFTRMFSLQRHYLIHTGERGFKCEVCDALFRTGSQLKSHVLTHTGERPFKCHICPATFIQQGNLKRHIWTHTGEKPHVCSTCGAGFLSTSDLKRHVRIHTGEKPYKCHICSCSFTTSGNLKSHLKTHSIFDMEADELMKRTAPPKPLARKKIGAYALPEIKIEQT